MGYAFRSSTRSRGMGGALALLVVAVITAGVPAADAAPVGEVVEFPVAAAKSFPSGIAAGPDGNLWFTEPLIGQVARITPAGQITEYSTGITAASGALGIALGPDGDMWFTEYKSDRIGRISPAGNVAEFDEGLTPIAEPWWIAAGPDGNMWFTERHANKVGRITPGGVITEFSTGITGTGVVGITAGPDGNMWFTETSGAIARITPAGVVTEFHEGLLPGDAPEAIASGADGNLWFTDGAQDAIGRFEIGGHMAGEFGLPTKGSAPAEIAPGPDSAMWFTEFEGNQIGRITGLGTITEYPVPTPKSLPFGITPGADGSIWFTEEHVSAIGRVGTGAPPAFASGPAVSGGGMAGALQTCTASWSPWARQEPSPRLFGFDGYTWLLDGAPVASGQTYVPLAAQAGHQLACAASATYPLLAVTASATSAPVTVTAVSAAPTPPVPVIGALRESAARWRRGSKLARISRRRTPPVGTTFSFTLNVPALATLTFTKQTVGRRVGARCVPVSKGNAHRRRCVRPAPAGVLSFNAHAGLNKIAFQGRLSARRRLPRGTYLLRVVAVIRAGARSSSPSLRFVIVS